MTIVKKVIQNEDIKQDMKKFLHQLTKYNRLKDLDDIEYLKMHVQKGIYLREPDMVLSIDAKIVDIVDAKCTECTDAYMQTEYELVHSYSQTEIDDDYIEL